ncbi:MAG: cell division protein FtsZ [Candidatus Jidaibacter sp.]|jgi:cell division protein FtsZ|nr:cell division protein FtsZ [Candidatus Jidaibacter sp.]
MSIKISLPESFDMKPKITVFGVGGAGGNAVNNMISSSLEGVEFWIANTDAQAIDHALTNNRIQLGAKATLGLGAGSHPEVGKQAAEESLDEVMSILENTNMVFITAGMGGGTGTGAAPVIAKAAKDKGILTVGVVTKPFHFEGARRMKVAELGLEELNKYVDTLIVIPNQNLFRIANENTTFADAFKMADDVLHSGVRGITDLITMPGLINLDFADIRTVMSEMGKAMMGTGEADGENRAVMAAEAAISNPLLDNSSMKGARGVLINITGGSDMTLFQVDAAANRIREEVDPNANIIFGSAYNADLDGKIRVSVVATGIDSKMAASLRPAPEAAEVSQHISVRQQEAFSQSAFDMHNEMENEDSEEASEDDENSFIPPKPVEFSNYGSLSAGEPANSQEELSSDEQHGYQKADNEEEPKDENFGRKSKEDFFDIPAFIRKKIKF